MRAVRAIAINTFREAIRDRILYLFVGFAVVLVVSTKLFGMLTVGDEAKIIKDIGLASMQFFSMLIAVMMSMLLVSREVDSRTVFNVLAKPVRRWQFLLGKYLGLVAIVAANLVFDHRRLVRDGGDLRTAVRPDAVLCSVDDPAGNAGSGSLCNSLCGAH